MTANWPFGDLRPQAYGALSIDPPWKFSAGTKGRPQHYPRMADDEIAAMPISDLCHPTGCCIFLWITSPVAERFWRVIAPAWRKQGVRYSGRAFVWVKTTRAHARRAAPAFFHEQSLHVGQGFTTRKNVEDVLLFKTGKPKRLRKDIREIIISPLRAHSQKPEEAYRRIELFSDGPYAELFSRTTRQGWDAWGDEVGKLDGPDTLFGEAAE